MGPATQGNAVSESYDSPHEWLSAVYGLILKYKSNCSVTPGRRPASPSKENGGACHP